MPPHAPPSNSSHSEIASKKECEMKNAAKHEHNIEAHLEDLRTRLEKVEAALDEPADPDL